MRTWISDSNGNKASVERCGSEEAARESLANLVDCDNCSDCSDCSGCSRCSDCSGCSDCSDCSHCSGCSRCSHCSGCSHCSHCSGCSDCSRCSGCSDFDATTQTEFETKKVGCFNVPIIPNIHKTIYDAVCQPNALDMSNWHSCETTHCRAGWVVHKAGPLGYALERQTSPVFAAMLIYEASGYEIAPPRFYDANEAALADMKRLAEQETTAA